MDSSDTKLASTSFAVECAIDITEKTFREFKNAVVDERFELFRMLREARSTLEMVDALWDVRKNSDREIVRLRIREIYDALKDKPINVQNVE